MDMQIFFKLILYYYIGIDVKKLNIISCWKAKDQYDFLSFAVSNLISIKFVELIDNEKCREDIKKQCKYETNTKEGFVFDYSCESSNKIVMQLSQLQCFTLTRYWLIYENRTNFALSDFRFVNLSIDAHITYSNQTENKQKLFRLYDVYNNGKVLGGQLNVTFDRTLNCNNYILNDSKELCAVVNRSNLRSISFIRNRATMSDITMRVATVITSIDINQSEEILLEYMNSANGTHVDNVPRYGYRLALVLRDMLGYNVSWFHSPIWTRNYTSGGVLSAMLQERIEFASAPYILDAPRLNGVRIVFGAVQTFRSTFLFRTEQNFDLTGSRFTKPFELKVWLCILALIAVFGLALKKIFTMEANLVNCRLSPPTYLLAVLSSFGVVCQQDSSMLPISSGGRMLYAFLLMTCFILYNYYTSLIVASLLGSPMKSNIKTLTQLADSNLEIGIEDVPYTRAYLTFPRPDLAYFVKKKIDTVKNPESIWIPPGKGIWRARKPGFAYHCDATIGYIFVANYFEPHEVCDLNEVELQTKKSLGILLKKESPYNDVFKTKLIWMAETGIVSKHYRYWFKTRPQCMSQNFVESVGIGYVAPVFLVLTIGTILSILIFIIEAFVARIHLVGWV